MNTLTTTSLTTTSLAALRKAKFVSFHSEISHLPGGGDKLYKTSTITTYEDDVDLDNLSKIATNLSVYGSARHKAGKFHDSISTAQYDDEWQTIVSLLKAGDRLELVWFPDYGTNQYLEHATKRQSPGNKRPVDLLLPEYDGLHGDRLSIRVNRTGRTGKVRTFQFHVRSSVAPDNSARQYQAA